MASALSKLRAIASGLYFQWLALRRQCISAWSFAAQSVAMQQAPLVLFPVINKLTSDPLPTNPPAGTIGA
jgi:hypothetical protein